MNRDCSITKENDDIRATYIPYKRNMRPGSLAMQYNTAKTLIVSLLAELEGENSQFLSNTGAKNSYTVELSKCTLRNSWAAAHMIEVVKV